MTFDSKQKKRLLTAASVFAIALGTGFLMQNLSPMTERFVGGEGETVVAGSAGPSVDIKPLSAAPNERLAEIEVNGPRQPVAPAEVTRALSAAPVPEAVELAALDFEQAPAEIDTVLGTPDPAAGVTAPEAEETLAEEPAPDCKLRLGIEVREAAMARLAFSAPCNPGEVVTLRHGGLVVTEMTDDAGAVTVDIPALARKASFEARLDNGERALAMTLVKGAEDFERTVLMWQGRAGVALHAFENGAGFGEVGHVSAVQPADPTRATGGDGGFLTALGSADLPGAQLAEVYSYPRAAEGAVSLSVEAEVTAANCGRDMSARILMDTGEGLTAQPLTAAMPDCDAIGELLVFSGVLPERRYAAVLAAD